MFSIFSFIFPETFLMLDKAFELFKDKELKDSILFFISPNLSVILIYWDLIFSLNFDIIVIECKISFVIFDCPEEELWTLSIKSVISETSFIRVENCSAESDKS